MGKQYQSLRDSDSILRRQWSEAHRPLSPNSGLLMNRLCRITQYNLFYGHFCFSQGHKGMVHSTDTRFGPKVGQIGPKWDKSGKFSDQIQYILAHRAKMY